jgi:CRP/FNR family cyclic AMP-dependent transcriptional regulator
VDGAGLATIPLFAELSSEKRGELAEVCSDVDVPAGETLVREGDFGFAMFVIREGTAEVMQGGNVIRTLNAGDVFGEIAILSSGRRTATVVAKTPMRLTTVMNRDIWRLERESPEIAESLRETIARCLER